MIVRSDGVLRRSLTLKACVFEALFECIERRFSGEGGR